MGGKPAVPFATMVLISLLKDKDPEIRAQVAKALARFLVGNNSDALIALLNDPDPRVRFFAAQSLGRRKNTRAIDPLLQLLRQNADQDAYLVHAGVWALLNIGDLDAIQVAAKNENVSIRRAALLAIRHMERPEITQFLNDSEPKLVVEAARAINDVPINDAMPQLAALLNSNIANLESNEFAQVIRRSINANFRLGQNSNAVELASFAANTKALEAMRVEALDALSDWENPNPLDRVMGLWRPLPKRDKQIAVSAIQSATKQLLEDSNEKVVNAVIVCLRKLGMNEFFSTLFELFKNPKSTSTTRVEILRTFMASSDPHLPKAVELAFASSDAALRREAIKAVALLSPEQTPLLLERLLASEADLRISQTAFATLGTLTNSAAADVLTRQLDRLLAGEIAPELQLDVLEAAAKPSDSRLAAKIAAFKSKFLKDDPLAVFRATLVGGDAERGKKIFHEREDVACLRCHAIKGKGGNVGPDLGGISKTQSREYLLESIVYPNKTIAPGFENILVTTKGGSVYAGLVKREDATELVVNSPEDGIVKIKKADIEKRDRGLSSMPEGIGNVLSKPELRDLIEFLAGLK
jgi:quinoprotein glucose dehydrogenase